MKAERETADRLIAHFLADRVGAIFDGHISGVTRAGLFVELDETGADGFIPARNIGEEYFRFDEAGRAFVGRSATHRLGDPVTVELVEAAPVAGALRFRLIDGGRSAGMTKRSGHAPRPNSKDSSKGGSKGGSRFGAKSGSKPKRGRHSRRRRR
jgi:ribonuclease R